MRRRLNAEEREWRDKHKKQIPDMRTGRKGMRYMGDSNDLGRVCGSPEANPRRGSDVYVTDQRHLNIGGYFTIVTGHTEFGRKLEGAPTMPIKQWIHRQAKRGPKSVKQ